MREWLSCFATIGPAINLEDLVLLGDCYYLPHEEGPEAEALYRQAKALVTPGAGDPESRGRRLCKNRRSVCATLCGRKLIELHDRALSLTR